MSTIPEIKARLLGDGTPFALVAGAGSFAQVKDRPPAMPAAYVLVPNERAADNDRATGPVLQRVERLIAVLIIVEDLGDADGDAVQDQLETIKSWTRQRLVGLVPADMAETVTYAGGELLEAVAGCVWYELTFNAPAYFEEVPDGP